MRIAKVTRFDPAGREVLVIETQDTIHVEVAGVRVTFGHGHPGSEETVLVRLDPTGRDGHYSLKLRQVSANSTQVFLSVEARCGGRLDGLTKGRRFARRARPPNVLSLDEYLKTG